MASILVYYSDAHCEGQAANFACVSVGIVHFDPQIEETR